jgi:hypothetical protein
MTASGLSKLVGKRSASDLAPFERLLSVFGLIATGATATSPPNSEGVLDGFS